MCIHPFIAICFIIIAYMDFGFVPVNLCALTSCHVVISKQGVGSASRQAGRAGVQPERYHVL